MTYGGNAYKNSSGTQSGADGISFFLADGSQPATVGALGGSLGYNCSNGNSTYDGVVGGYIGLGIDEYGNASSGDNTNTGPGHHPRPYQPAWCGQHQLGQPVDQLLAVLPDFGMLDITVHPPVQEDRCTNGHFFAKGRLRTCRNGQGDGSNDGGRTYREDPLTTTTTITTGDTLSGVTPGQEATNNPVRGSAAPITYGLRILGRRWSCHTA